MNSHRTKKKHKSKQPLPNGPNSAVQRQPAHESANLITDRDDLLAITGIASVLEFALNVIGVQKYSDFDDYTPESLAKTLSERAGQTISPNIVRSQDWIGTAKKLSELQKNTMVHEDNKPPASKSEKVEAKGKYEKEKSMDLRTPETKTPASRGIFDEGKIQAGDFSTAGVQTITDLPNALENPAPTTAKPSDVVASKKQLELKITEVKIRPFDDAVTGLTMDETKLQAEITSRLILAKGYTLPEKGVSISAQIHAYNSATNTIELLASKPVNYQNGHSDFKINLEFSAPPTGRYKLQVVLLLLEATPEITLHEGPFLQVEE